LAGVTSDATNIYVEDNSDPSAGGDGSYSFADIFAVLGGTGVDLLRVDSGTGVPTYRFLKNLQIGNTGGTLPTTLQDNNVVCTFDAGRVLKTRLTSTTGVTCQFGTKVGSGNTESGKKGVWLYFTNTAGANTVILRGTVKWYGVCAQSTQSGGTQALQFPNQNAGASELVNCIFGGFTGYVLGSSGASLSNIYNVDITGDVAAGLITSFFVDSASRITVGGGSGFQLATGSAGIAFKDAVFLGTPITSDLQMASGLATNWLLVRPQFSGNAPKFSNSGPATASSGAQEYWIYDVKVVDRNGVAVAGIPVSVTDVDGNVQINATTNSTGQITYGSGLTANCLVLADHYNAGGVAYAIHHRSPYTTRINTGLSRNSNYMSRTFKWFAPGYETITTSSGSFEDISDIVPIEDSSGAGTVWIELTL
jgi:hypothetical protein